MNLGGALQAVINDVLMSWREQGSGEPIVYVHAFPFHSAMWDGQLAALPAGWRGIAPDLRGFGKTSAAGDGPYTMDLFADDLAALCEIRRVLKPAGRFLLETMHRDEVICGFAERDAWTLPDGTEVKVRRRFDPLRGISYERLRWQRGTQRGEKRHALKLRTATEVDVLLKAAGFCDLQYYGAWDGSPFTHRSEHLIALATAP